MFIIPESNLPSGFLERLSEPIGKPAVPVPAATVVLMRDGRAGPEALLLQRHRSSGFVPGAYVFPGGRVDDADADPALLARTIGLLGGTDSTDRTERTERTGHTAGSRRTGRSGRSASSDHSARAGHSDRAGRTGHTDGSARTGRNRGPTSRQAGQTNKVSAPGPAFWLAAVREAFEETGALLATSAAAAADDVDLKKWRQTLLRDEAALLDVLEALNLELDLGDMVHLAHWITPEREPRRYDTHFFLARWPAGVEVDAHAAEMTDALWATPADALERFHAGRLPMIFPTVHTLEALAGFDGVATAMDAFRNRTVEPIVPRLVRTTDGVGMVVD